MFALVSCFAGVLKKFDTIKDLASAFWFFFFVKEASGSFVDGLSLSPIQNNLFSFVNNQVLYFIFDKWNYGWWDFFLGEKRHGLSKNNKYRDSGDIRPDPCATQMGIKHDNTN